jgi:hypothetical protein
MKPADLVLAALARNQLLLKQDKVVPNVVGILTGESLSTSWWSHPKARLIFAVLSQLADHPDVLFAKLLYRKDTLIHRPLWPALLAVGLAREPWQARGLSDDAKRLLERVDRGEDPVRAAGEAVRELEVRLLATTREVHTESGRHAMAIESWQTWTARVGCGPALSVPDARNALEGAAARIGAPPKALPWPTPGAATTPTRSTS